MAHSVRYLPFKHENLTSKVLGTVVDVCNLIVVMAEVGGSLGSLVNQSCWTGKLQVKGDTLSILITFYCCGKS